MFIFTHSGWETRYTVSSVHMLPMHLGGERASVGTAILMRGY
jgi:hypothetical protein